ncbi:hypothetical protein ABEB36_000083 [Hypothenemus hampei]|uniref:C2H2-type domain-containing protein n=1 Tax=Hypothenemus hampei TaxID=57062 RepID=A0ABD1FA64_HYPHA
MNLTYCNFCTKKFSNPYNLNKHLKQIHAKSEVGTDGAILIQKPKLGSEQIQDVSILNTGKTKDIMENKQYIKHPEERNYLKSFKDKKKKSYNFLCDQCPKQFIYLTNLKSHMKTHETGAVSKKHSKKEKKCVLCDHICNNLDMLSHYEQNHNISIQNSNMVFSNIEDFYIWKDKYENETNSLFIKNCNTLREGYIYKSFKCNRSGTYVSKSSGIRHLKMKGSNKINGFCPAAIKLKKSGEEYHVHVIHTHVGHKTAIGHLNHKKSEREILAAKIALKIPFDDILDEIRDSISDSNLKRIHLLTKKDLYNIESSFNLHSTTIRHQNDLVSLESWISEMQNKTDHFIL